MKERPILFSAPMVRAILAGTKTQTRRTVKPQTLLRRPITDAGFGFLVGGRDYRSSYGQPGDRLWVKETWRTDFILDSYAPRELAETQPIKFDADGESTGIVAFEWGKVRQSIFMRRWMSRITLEIVSVRVERLNEISEADARAEGIEEVPDNSPFCGKPGWRDYSGDGLLPFDYDKPQASYRTLWESINGPGSWAANPWVWVVEFRRVNA